MESVRDNVCFDRSFIVNNKGSNGGLAMMWKSDFDIEVETYKNFHI